MKNKLTCEQILDLISSFIDGELTEEEQNAAQDHFDHCPECAEELKMVQQLSLRVQQTLELENIPDFSAAILSKLEAESVSCKQVEENLSAYFDGEMDTNNYYAIKNHLDECKDCEPKYKKLEYLRNLIKLSVDSLDLDLWSTVYNRLVDPEELECSFVSDKLSEYIDKEMDKKLYKAISEHILACPICRKEFDDLKYLQTKVKIALLEPSKNIDLWPDIFYRLSRRARKKTFAYSSVASLAMVVFVWFSLSVIFPVGNVELTDKDYSTVSEAPKKEAAYTVASNDNTADSYLLNSTFSTPPSGVIPIMYQGDMNDY